MKWFLLVALAAAACPSAAPPVVPKSPETSPVAVSAPAPPSAPSLDAVRAAHDAGDNDGAIQLATRRLVAIPDDALALVERSGCLLEAGEAKRAFDDAARATELAPANPRAWRLVGQASEDLGDRAGAISAYEKALSLREEPTVRRRLASLLAAESRWVEAVPSWEAVRAAEPGDVAARLELATAYEKVDRPASAEAELRVAVTLAPALVAVQRRLVEVLEKQGKMKEARAARAELEKLEPRRDDRKLRPLLPSRK